MFVRKFDVVVEGLMNQIGEPMEYALFKQANFQNEKGSNKIPSVVAQPKKVWISVKFKNLLTYGNVLEKSTNFGFEQWAHQKLYDFEYALHDDWGLAGEGQNFKKIG